MAAVRNLIVRGGADFSGLRRGMQQLRTSTQQMQTNFQQATTGMSKAANQVSRVIRTAFAVVGVTSMAALGKQAIDTASDLQEIQNVVDTAFGRMANSAETFAKKARAFGLSELQAKKSASTYMAMARSLGVAEERAASMSMAAAALTGDMSSFFNVSQDVADTAVKSIWTGETESLKSFGVVMTEANLEAYALAKGLGKTYANMSQAEKVMTRYNYVMEQLAYVQGDAQKTAGSWANQVRTTGQRLSETMSYFGSGLINVLNGVFKPLNAAIDRLQCFAKLFQSVTAQLFGNAGGSSGSTSMATATAEAASSAADIATGIEDAEKAAKRATLSIDQLHTLSYGDSGSASNTSTGGSLAGIDVGADAFYLQAIGADDVIDDGTAKEIEARATRIADSIRGAFSKVRMVGDWLGFGEAIGPIDKLRSALTGLPGLIKKNQEALITLGSAGGAAFAAIKIGGFLQKLGGISGILTGIGKAIGSVIGMISSPVVLIGAAVAAVVAGFVQLYQQSEGFQKVINNTLASIAENLGAIGSVAASIWSDTVAPLLSDLWDMIQRLWNELLAPIGALIGEGILAIVDLITGVMPTILSAVGAGLDGIADGIRGLIEIVGGVIDIIYGIVEGFLTGDWSRLWAGAGSVVTGIFDTIGGVIKGVANLIISIINAVTGTLNLISIDVPEVLGGGKIGFDIPQIPSLASGGVAYSEQIVRVGEYAGAGSNPELIAPQSVLADTVEGANGTVVDALYTVASRICQAIKDNRAVVNVGGKMLADDVTRQQNDRAKMTGKPILAT